MSVSSLPHPDFLQLLKTYQNVATLALKTQNMMNESPSDKEWRFPLQYLIYKLTQNLQIELLTVVQRLCGVKFIHKVTL